MAIARIRPTVSARRAPRPRSSADTLVSSERAAPVPRQKLKRTNVQSVPRPRKRRRDDGRQRVGTVTVEQLRFDLDQILQRRVLIEFERASRFRRLNARGHGISTGRQEADMGLIDVLNGMQNGPRGQRTAAPAGTGGGGMSPM